MTNLAATIIVRDEQGRTLASAKDINVAAAAAYNRACVIYNDATPITLTYFDEDNNVVWYEHNVTFKQNIMCGYPHTYKNSEKVIVDYCYYMPTNPHRLFDDKDEALDYIHNVIVDTYLAGFHDDDETLDEFIERELSYWMIIPARQWREDARIKRFGHTSVPTRL